nr:unnamed protein product [uncultured bacterium]
MSAFQTALFDISAPTLAYLEQNFPEVGPSEFYRELFPEGELERKGVYETGKYCGIAVQIGGKKVSRYSVTDDLDVIDELIASDDFCVMSPVSYAGKTQQQSMARWLYAIVIDVDDLIEEPDGRGEPSGIAAFIYQARNNVRAMPTFIVSSGTGVHLYYVLEQPIALYRNVICQLENLRRDMVKDIWNRYVTNLHESPQYESVTQGFRMVGSITKNGRRVRAFRTGNVVTIEELNDHIVHDSNRLTELHYRSELTLEQAREKYPDWYQKRIIEQRPRGSWTVKRALYDWWKNRADEARYGHRYFFIMALAIYAMKCGVDEEELVNDALALVPQLNTIQTDKPFTRSDALKACQMYNADYQTYPRRSIERLTAITIPPNRRNGRKQATHLQLARLARDLNCESTGTNWWDNGNRNGAPTKEHVVRAWRNAHPGGSKAACERETGLSRPTVLKWWNAR